MITSESSPNDEILSDHQAKSLDPGPHAIPEVSGDAERKKQRVRPGNSGDGEQKRTQRGPESHRTDRRRVPPESWSLLSIAKEGRMSYFGAHELLTIWASATGVSLRSGDDRLKTVRCDDIYVATGRAGSGHMSIHWNVEAGIVSAVEQPEIWASMAMTTLANLVFPERLQDEKDHTAESERMRCYGRCRPSGAEVEDLIDTREDSPYNTTLRSLIARAHAAKSENEESIDVLLESRKRFGLDRASFVYFRNESGPVIVNGHGQFNARDIKSFLNDHAAVEAADRYLTCSDSVARAQRRLETYQKTQSPWKIRGLGPDEYERWPTPDEWRTHASRQVAKALYRMTSIRRIELDRLASEFNNDRDGMIKWRFSVTIDDTIRDIQKVLLEANVEIS